LCTRKRNPQPGKDSQSRALLARKPSFEPGRLTAVALAPVRPVPRKKRLTAKVALAVWGAAANKSPKASTSS
jgi:hypothetical protein